MTDMTHAQTVAAKKELQEAYKEYVSATAGARAEIREEYRILAEEAIEERLRDATARLGRAIARNPLPVREKQIITSSTNWNRYKGFLTAADEVDISGRLGQQLQKLERLENELAKNSGSQKTEPAKNSIPVEDVTEKMRSWEWYEGTLEDFPVTAEDKWFETTPTPGGASRLWAMSDAREKPLLMFEVAAGDDEWTSPRTEVDRGESKWDDERKAVLDAFNGREAD